MPYRKKNSFYFVFLFFANLSLCSAFLSSVESFQKNSQNQCRGFLVSDRSRFNRIATLTLCWFTFAHQVIHVYWPSFAATDNHITRECGMEAIIMPCYRLWGHLVKLHFPTVAAICKCFLSMTFLSLSSLALFSPFLFWQCLCVPLFCLELAIESSTIPFDVPFLWHSFSFWGRPIITQDIHFMVEVTA